MMRYGGCTATHELPRKDGGRNNYRKTRGHNVAAVFLPQGSLGIGAAATVELTR
jgi:hypothetical protein